MTDTEQQPKKPMTAYWLYLGEHREAIVKEIGASKGSAVAKKAGEQWKAISDEERKPFEERAAKMKAEYDEALKAFKDGGGVVSKKSKKGKKDKKAKKDPNAPKKPVAGGYGVYLIEQRGEIKKGLPDNHKQPDVAKVAGARWKALPDAEKKPYEEQFAAKQEEYKKALAEFKAAAAARGEDEKQEKEAEAAASPKAKKAKKDPNAPKEPVAGGYDIYLNEQREEIKKGLPDKHKISDVTKVARAGWKALPGAEKKAYKEQAAAKQKEYKKALAEFKAAGGEDEKQEKETESAASPPPKAATGKRGLDKSSEKKMGKGPYAKRGRPAKSSPQEDAPEIEPEVLAEAQKLQLEGVLKNLAARSEIVALNLPAKKILSALQNSNGLVNPAKHALLGA